MTFVKRIENLIAKKFLMKNDFPQELYQIQYAYSFCLSGCIGMIKAWLFKSEHESPDAMAKSTYPLIDNTAQEYLYSVSQKSISKI